MFRVCIFSVFNNIYDALKKLIIIHISETLGYINIRNLSLENLYIFFAVISIQ